jgi:hypothetical protein
VTLDANALVGFGKKETVQPSLKELEREKFQQEIWSMK